MKSLTILGRQEAKVMNSVKQEYKTPNPEVIAMGDMEIARVWRRICPICREEFYSYRNIKKDDSYFPDGYLEPVSNHIDENGQAKFRQTCGSNECYNAEHSHWERVSRFNKRRDDLDEKSKPKKYERPTNLL